MEHRASWQQRSASRVNTSRADREAMTGIKMEEVTASWLARAGEAERHSLSDGVLPH